MHCMAWSDAVPWEVSAELSILMPAKKKTKEGEKCDCKVAVIKPFLCLGNDEEKGNWMHCDLQKKKLILK